MPSIITVDGPSGVGKSTLSQMLAAKLGWHFLDSGALYRVLAYAAILKNIPLDAEDQLAELARVLPIQFQTADPTRSPQVLLNGQDITSEIRTESHAQLASKVSAFPKVRAALVDCQRAFIKPPGLVAEGRDQGTVIFPEAKLKFFLTASSEARAARRLRQLEKRGIETNLKDLIADIIQRDERDRNRIVAPLRPAEDAIIIDTSRLSLEESWERLWSEVGACALLS